MVPCDSDHDEGYFRPHAAALNKVQNEVEQVVSLICAQILRVDKLLDVFDFAFKLNVSLELSLGLWILRPNEHEDTSDHFGPFKDSRQIVCKVSCIVLLRPDPVLNKPCSLWERAKGIKGLHELHIWIHSILFILHFNVLGWVAGVNDGLVFINHFLQ